MASSDDQCSILVAPTELRMSPIGTLNLLLMCRPNNQQIPEKLATLAEIQANLCMNAYKKYSRETGYTCIF